MLPQAILFDMDGTLTQPYLDFDRLKREMGVGSGDALKALAVMEPQQRKTAEQVLQQHEDRAALESTLNPGCIELLDWLKAAGIETAVVTRNCRRSVGMVFDRHGLRFNVCITREDGKFKPDPAPLELACQRLGVDKKYVWMVGDSWHDVDAGIAAGVRTIWVSHGKDRSFVAKPWRTVTDLRELKDVLVECKSRR